MSEEGGGGGSGDWVGEFLQSETFAIIFVLFIGIYFASLLIKNLMGVAAFRNSSKERSKQLKQIDPHALQRVKSDIIRSAKTSKPRGPDTLWLTGDRHISRIKIGHISGLLETNSLRWLTVQPYTLSFFGLFTVPLSKSRIIAVHKDYCSHPTSPDVYIRATGLEVHADAFWVACYTDGYYNAVQPEKLLELWKDAIMDWKVWMNRFQHLVQTDLAPRLLVRALNPSISDRAKELYPAGPPREMAIDAETGQKWREPPKGSG
tara:strand:- start:8042 stop:8827 length:786 start_codon:yes stop_codon:yes gene_type:complete